MNNNINNNYDNNNINILLTIMIIPIVGCIASHLLYDAAFSKSAEVLKKKHFL